MTDPEARVRATLTSLTDDARGVVATYAGAILNCLATTACFTLDLEPCMPADWGHDQVHVDMPRHPVVKTDPAADARRVQPGDLTETNVNATAAWENKTVQDRARVRLARPKASDPPYGLFVGRVRCEPERPGMPWPAARFVIYRDGLPPPHQ
jgi:hypothetical protein